MNIQDDQCSEFCTVVTAFTTFTTRLELWHLECQKKRIKTDTHGVMISIIIGTYRRTGLRHAT
jgi:hypothetical protein